jgi:hypothetical protein
LLTDFLSIDIGDINIDKYYKSELVQQLLSLKTMNNDQQFRECLQSLDTFHIKYKYQQAADQLESGTAQFQSIRMHLTHNEIKNLDNKFEKLFKDLKSSQSMENINEIRSLVLTEGAKLECLDCEYLREYNFAETVNYLLLNNLSSVEPVSQRLMNASVEMLESLIISNLKLLHNRAYAAYGSCAIYYFLSYAVYQCQEVNCSKSFRSFSIQCYRAVVD